MVYQGLSLFLRQTQLELRLIMLLLLPLIQILLNLFTLKNLASTQAHSLMSFKVSSLTTYLKNLFIYYHTCDAHMCACIGGCMNPISYQKTTKKTYFSPHLSVYPQDRPVLQCKDPYILAILFFHSISLYLPKLRMHE